MFLSPPPLSSSPVGSELDQGISIYELIKKMGQHDFGERRTCTASEGVSLCVCVCVLKPEALGSTPGGATFLSCPMPFQRSTDSDGPDCVFKLDTIGLRTMEESRPSDSSPCCDYACDLSYINYAHSNQL